MNREKRIQKIISFLVGAGYISAKSAQTEIAEKTNYNYRNVNSAINGNEKYLTDNFLKKLNDAFDGIFNESWLLTGEGEMLKTGNNTGVYGNVSGSSIGNITAGNNITNNISLPEAGSVKIIKPDGETNIMPASLIEEAPERIKELEERLRECERELLKSKDEIINLLKHMSNIK